MRRSGRSDRFFWTFVVFSVLLAVVGMAVPGWWGVGIVGLACACSLGALVVVIVYLRRDHPASPRPGG